MTNYEHFWEFIMTYGWAIMVLISIGTLFYFFNELSCLLHKDKNNLLGTNCVCDEWKRDNLVMSFALFDMEVGKRLNQTEIEEIYEINREVWYEIMSHDYSRCLKIRRK